MNPTTRAEIAANLKAKVLPHDIFAFLEIRHIESLFRDSEEAEKLRAFANDIMQSWPDGEVDGYHLQDIAFRHGLLYETKPLKPCAENCSCVEYFGIEGFEVGLVACYHKSELLKGHMAMATDSDSQFRQCFALIDAQIDTCEYAIENGSDEAFEDAKREMGIDIPAELRAWKAARKLLELATAMPHDKIINADQMILLRTDKA